MKQNSARADVVMRAKVTLTKNVGMKQVQNNHWLPILTIKLSRKTKETYKEYESVNFVSKDVSKILSSHKISEKYNAQKVFHKKAVLKNFAIFTGRHLCRDLRFNKNRPAALLKRDSNTCAFLQILRVF